MALTRAAFLPWYASRVIRGAGRPVAALLLPLLLSACAAGVEDGFLDDLTTTYDAASMAPPVVLPPAQEAGVILPPAEAGPVVPDIPRDAGGGTTRDTGTSAPRDAGSSTPADAGSQAPLDAGTRPPLDAGSQPPLDAGTQPQVDAGGGTTDPNMCSTAPSYPTTTACGKCTCMKCGTQVTSCAASAESAKNTQCLAVRSCAEKNSCMGQECYCGSSLLCLSPDGPCVQEIQAAAGGGDLSAVQNASMDPSSPLGRSVAVGECQAMNCRSECGL